MSSTLELKGTITIDGGSCTSGCATSNADSTVRALGDGCGGKSYDSVFSTSKPIQLATGIAGVDFVDLPLGESLEAIEFLMLRSSSAMTLRVDAEAAQLLGAGGSFPTAFAGGETAIVIVDASTVTTTFEAGDQTAEQVAARMNGAFAVAGLATPRVTVVGGQLAISSVRKSEAGLVTITSAPATLGLSGTASGAGAEFPFEGLLVIEFPRGGSAPGLLQISGNGNLSAVVGGR